MVALRKSLSFTFPAGSAVIMVKSPITTLPGGPVDPVLATIARRIGGTPAQVIFKWVHAKGFVVVTTTASRTHLDDYLHVVELRTSSPFLVLSSFQVGS